MMQDVSTTQSLVKVTQALGDERRIRILFALLDGRALPATRLAIEAGVAPSTASAHLKRLVEAGLVQIVPPPPHYGRHRYYQIAGPEIADMCESLSALHGGYTIASLQPDTHEAAMREARLCYDHVAGRLGVRVMDALIEHEILTPHGAGFAITAPGEHALSRMGIDVTMLRSGRRQMIRHCIDWSEQQPHLSGALGSALREQLELRGWIQRLPTNRVLILTASGRSGLKDWFGLSFEA